MAKIRKQQNLEGKVTKVMLEYHGSNGDPWLALCLQIGKDQLSVHLPFEPIKEEKVLSLFKLVVMGQMVRYKSAFYSPSGESYSLEILSGSLKGMNYSADIS